MNELPERVELEDFRALLSQLGDHIREQVCSGRSGTAVEALSAIADRTAADTIYAIDKVSEAAVLDWFARHWPVGSPVELVMEGLEAHGPVTFPRNTPPAACAWKCVIDPIDGTRPLMYDKRAAWALCALAPQKGPSNTLADIVVAAMTEIPTTKAAFADQLSAVRGGGPSGVRARRLDLRTGAWQAFELRPSRARSIEHGFGQFAKFFPEGKSLLAEMEARLCERLTGRAVHESPVLFDDQYISTGGQFYEIAIGHDRFVADLRPEVFRRLGYASTLVCHPYDACCWPILVELGCPIGKPDGSPLDAPLDTTSPVSWVAYANPDLAALIRPVLRAVIAELAEVRP